MARKLPIQLLDTPDDGIGSMSIVTQETFWSYMAKKGRFVQNYEAGGDTYTTGSTEVQNLIGLELGKMQMIKELVISTTTDVSVFVRHDYGDNYRGVEAANKFQIVFDGYLKALTPLYLKGDGDWIFFPGDEIRVFITGLTSGGTVKQCYSAVSLPYPEN